MCYSIKSYDTRNETLRFTTRVQNHVHIKTISEQFFLKIENTLCFGELQGISYAKRENISGSNYPV